MTERGHDHGAVCLCVTEHSPAPLEYEWHHVLPLAMGGEDTPVGEHGENGVWVCPTTHTNVHELLRLILRGVLKTYRDAYTLYDPPVNRYAWGLAREGADRFRAMQEGA